MGMMATRSSGIGSVNSDTSKRGSHLASAFVDGSEHVKLLWYPVAAVHVPRDIASAGGFSSGLRAACGWSRWGQVIEELDKP